jgi:hypothetical protein
MTDHPITPSLELVQQWTDEIYGGPGVVAASDDICLAKLAAQWGADQELEACCEWLDREGWSGESRQLRAARRPKPPSLKEQALDDLKTMTTVPPGMSPLAPETVERIERIRCALEALPND